MTFAAFRRVCVAILLAASGLAGACTGTPPASDTPDARATRVRETLATERVSHDPDDPAIWINDVDPARSLVIGTNKVASPDGALVVFGLDGRIRQTIAGLDRPNNVDVEYGVSIGGRLVDIAVVTERLQHRLRVFTIASEGPSLVDAGAIPVLEGQHADASEPMGISLYKRPRDGAVFAIVAPKAGPREGYLWQYRLVADASGQLRGQFVRRFGVFSGAAPAADESGEIEAVVVDDELGYVYYSDERFGIRKWLADPDAAGADRELAVFGQTGYEMDREGLALFRRADGTGYLVSTDQIPGRSRLKFFPREGAPGTPHDHRELWSIETGSDDTDGIDVTARPLPGFPDGLVVMMNSGPRNFLFYRWSAVAR